MLLPSLLLLPLLLWSAEASKSLLKLCSNYRAMIEILVLGCSQRDKVIMEKLVMRIIYLRVLGEIYNDCERVHASLASRQRPREHAKREVCVHHLRFALSPHFQPFY